MASAFPTFLNKDDYEISAQLVVAGPRGADPIERNHGGVQESGHIHKRTLTTTGGNEALERTGLVWRSGTVTASVVPVMYSGGTISQIELALSKVDRTEGSPKPTVVLNSRGDEIESIIDAEAPFVATWENVAASSSNSRRVGSIEPGEIALHVITSAFSGGRAGPTYTGTAGSIRLDNDGPSVSDIHLAMQFNKHYDITNWVGADHAFTFNSDKETPDFSDGGVGRSRTDHEYSAGPSTSDVSVVSTPNDLDETTNDRAYVLGATVRDLLGNETVVWWAGAEGEDGLSNTGTDRGTVDRTDDYKFGVDLTAPTQELIDDDDDYIGSLGVISNAARAANRSVGIDYDDPGSGSGFSGSNVPVHTRIRRFAPDLSAQDGCLSPTQAFWYRTTCEILGAPGSHQTTRGGSTGDYNFMGQEYGYYAIEYAVMDDAGNRADFISVGGVLDNNGPVGNALVPATREMGERSTLSAFASDNLDLKQIDYFLGFGDHAYQQGSESVGTPSLPFEQSANASISIETFPGAIASGAGTSVGLSAHVVRIVDQARNATYASSPVMAIGTPVNILSSHVTETVEIDGDDDDTDTGEQKRTAEYSYISGEEAVTDDLAGAELCWDADDDGDCADDSEARATLTFAISGEGGVNDATGDTDDDPGLTAEAPENPFERVVFYVQLDDGDNPGTKWAYLGEGRGRAPEGTGVSRTFSWRLNVRGSDVAAAADLTAVGTDPVMIRAVGYTADGNAVVSTGTDLTITLEDDA